MSCQLKCDFYFLSGAGIQFRGVTGWPPIDGAEGITGVLMTGPEGIGDFITGAPLIVSQLFDVVHGQSVGAVRTGALSGIVGMTTVFDWVPT